MQSVSVHSFCVFHQAEYSASKHPGSGGSEKIRLHTCAVFIYVLLFFSRLIFQANIYSSHCLRLSIKTPVIVCFSWSIYQHIFSLHQKINTFSVVLCYIAPLLGAPRLTEQCHYFLIFASHAVSSISNPDTAWVPNAFCQDLIITCHRSFSVQLSLTHIHFLV